MKELKNIRKAKELSQLQLAEFLHTSPSTIAQWELGEKNARLGQVLLLCRILSCTPADLFCHRESGCPDSDFSIPVFHPDRHHCVSFHPLTHSHRLSSCQFGVVIPYDISGRICQGDICYFEMYSLPHPNDVVISVDCDGKENIFIAGKDHVADKNTVAVCRYLQSNF